MIKKFEIYVIANLPFPIRRWYFKMFQVWGKNPEKEMKILLDPDRFLVRVHSATKEEQDEIIATLRKLSSKNNI